MRHYFLYSLSIPGSKTGYIQVIGSHTRAYTLMFYKVESGSKRILYVANMS